MGNFGSYFEDKENKRIDTETFLNDSDAYRYMSPQQKQLIIQADATYNSFKADVYQLGMTTLAVAEFCRRDTFVELPGHDSLIRNRLGGLSCSQDFKNILLGALNFQEDTRSDIETIRDQASLLRQRLLNELESTSLYEDRFHHFQVSESKGLLLSLQLGKLEFPCPRSQWLKINRLPLSFDF